MFAIRAGKMIDGSGGAPIPGATLLVGGERILAAGPAQSVAIPSDCLVIDATAYTLLPGLIDAHVHVTHSGKAEVGSMESRLLQETTGLLAIQGMIYAQQNLMAGFTTIRDCGARNYVNLDVREAFAQGLAVGPRVVACGIGICSTGGHMDRNRYREAKLLDPSTVINSPDEARAAVRHQFKMGAEFIKIATDGLKRWGSGRITLRQELSRAELDAICEATHHLGGFVAAHNQGGPGMCDAIEAGIDTLEHLQGFSEAEMELIAQHGVILVPTLTATKCTVDAGNAPQTSPTGQERFVRWMEQNWRDKQAGMKRALKAGVRIALGTDAGYAHCYHGANAYEMELLVQEGMTPMQALVAATATAAEACQLGDELGQLRAGYYADFLLVEGDPLADISVLRDLGRMKAICKGGHFVKDEL